MGSIEVHPEYRSTGSAAIVNNAPSRLVSRDSVVLFSVVVDEPFDVGLAPADLGEDLLGGEQCLKPVDKHREAYPPELSRIGIKQRPRAKRVGWVRPCSR